MKLGILRIWLALAWTRLLPYRAHLDRDPQSVSHHLCPYNGHRLASAHPSPHQSSPHPCTGPSTHLSPHRGVRSARPRTGTGAILLVLVFVRVGIHRCVALCRVPVPLDTRLPALWNVGDTHQLHTLEATGQASGDPVLGI